MGNGSGIMPVVGGITQQLVPGWGLLWLGAGVV